MRTERSKRSVLQYVSIASTARMRNAERSSPCGNSRETNVLLALHDLHHQKRLGAEQLEARHRRIGLQARHDQHETDVAVEHPPTHDLGRADCRERMGRDDTTIVMPVQL